MSKSSSTLDINGQINFLETHIAEADRLYDKQLLEAAPHDITAFSEVIDPEFVPARHHALILSYMEKILHGENQRVLLVAPVGHGKSVYSSLVTPAFQMGLDPHVRIIAAGHTQSFVETAIARKVRGILMSDRYKKVFENTIVSQESRASDYLTLVPQRPGQPGHYLARGAGGGISGFRATRIFADDLYPNLSQANSKAFCEMVKEWWHGDLTKRLLPGGNIVLCNTRWTENDVPGMLIDAMKNGGEHWDVVNLPAICEDEENDPLGRKEGEALWPEVHSIEHLLRVKANTPARVFSCLYQNRPSTEGQGLLQTEWLRYWDQLPSEDQIRRRFVSFDVANTATQRADYTVGTAWCIGYDNRYYLTDIIRRRVEYPELVRLVDEFARRNKAQTILVEDAGHGKTLLQSIQGKVFAPLIGIKPHNRAKEMRFDSVMPLFEAGVVFLPKRHELLAELEHELLSFPNNGAHDDIVDSVSHALYWSKGSSVKRGVKKLAGGY